MTAPTRTIQFFGQAYGNTPVTLVATINGNELFNGAVSTVAGTPPIGLDTADQVLLFSVSFPGGNEGRGAFPMTVSVSGGDSVVLGIIKANYEPTGINTNNGASVFGPVFNGDARSSVTIDGIAQPDPVKEDGKKGTYAWLVHSGSTLAHNLNLA